uniref:HK97 family phage prohead protease n=1 Tax=Jiella sp. LLJ827 TaxID=2917712 RepID=UPI00350E41C7
MPLAVSRSVSARKRPHPPCGGGRTISALDLVEISLVTVPAHPGARITSRKAAANAIAIAEAINRAAAALKH